MRTFKQKQDYAEVMDHLEDADFDEEEIFDLGVKLRARMQEAEKNRRQNSELQENSK